MIALSLFSESRQLGIRCAESCDYSNYRAAAIGPHCLELFQFYLVRMDSPGDRALPGKTSRESERKSEMAGRLLEFSKLDRSLDTILTCLPEATIHIIKSRRQTFGATTRARRITIA